MADATGDSLALARQAAETDADVIVMAGVHFMAETAKSLNPVKTVLIPDLAAGCSLADVKAEHFPRLETFARRGAGRAHMSVESCDNREKELREWLQKHSNGENLPSRDRPRLGGHALALAEACPYSTVTDLARFLG